VAAVITYTPVGVLAMVLAIGRATGREAAVRDHAGADARHGQRRAAVVTRVAEGALSFIRHAGGFAVSNPLMVVPAGDIPQHLRVTAESVLLLYSASCTAPTSLTPGWGPAIRRPA
jgi:hypothetical protein